MSDLCIHLVHDGLQRRYLAGAQPSHHRAQTAAEPMVGLHRLRFDDGRAHSSSTEGSGVCPLQRLRDLGPPTGIRGHTLTHNVAFRVDSSRMSGFDDQHRLEEVGSQEDEASGGVGETVEDLAHERPARKERAEGDKELRQDNTVGEQLLQVLHVAPILIFAYLEPSITHHKLQLRKHSVYGGDFPLCTRPFRTPPNCATPLFIIALPHWPNCATALAILTLLLLGLQSPG
mmetsp:Transcript_23734/g.46761  ORF Transcript_23734/g.46761 Transcript_23734/m.46761 type:complete len:231 (+) Transcript_23734:734-1426(+)